MRLQKVLNVIDVPALATGHTIVVVSIPNHGWW